MNTKEEITFGIALLGAFLGVLNYWRSVDRDKIKLRVIPMNYLTSHGTDGMCIEVINTGYVPLTVTQIGILIRGRKSFVTLSSHMNDLKLPERMEPRTKITYYFPPETFKDPRLCSARKAFAKTACGKTFTETNAALKHQIRNLRREYQSI